ncbi:MAG: peptidoglycan DD-metalloendopeptidase family protein [Hyphomicrobiales bacterium]|nr:peptidoglycan DD-metalloendopeptidase family protein [Hyphomicrobiales bacterium]
MPGPKISGHGSGQCLPAFLVAAAVAGLLFPAIARAQPAPAGEAADMPMDAHQKKLRDLQKVIEAAQSQRRKIRSDLESLRNDRARLNTALIEATKGIQNSEVQIAGLERRLQRSKLREKGIRQSLYARRAMIAEILAALQRMGRRPPPALAISPGDILRAVRTSIMLGSVVPGMRADARILAADLEELLKVRKGIAQERDVLKKKVDGLGQERIRLAAILDARKDSVVAVEGALASEQKRAAQLAAQATTLKNLIASMESEIAAARRASAAARKAEAVRKKAARLKPGAKRNPFADRARITPAVAFSEAKGLLPLPVAGEIRRKFDEPDNFGGTETGLSIATGLNALVSSPADGWVVYAGPYRSYGQLLIVNVSDGYYIVLTGMQRLVVSTGQFVLAGEPVGSMGDGRVRTSATIAVGASKPVLYIEFRKDGAPVDPSPWWARPELEKVRG